MAVHHVNDAKMYQIVPYGNNVEVILYVKTRKDTLYGANGKVFDLI